LVLSAITRRGGAIGAGLHRLIAQHAVADVDLARRCSVDDLVLDEGRFADARLRVRARCRNESGSKKRKRKEYAATQIHFTNRSTVHHRTGSRAYAMLYI
jgi:hypothetical protein